MTSREELVRKADNEIRRYRPDSAAALYLKALDTAGLDRKQRLHCLQQLGVCEQLRGNWRKCLDWHNQALKVASTPVERANVLIDRSQAFREQGDFGQACQDLVEAIRTFMPKHLDRYAVASQFYGHTLLDMGEVAEAIKELETAAILLERVGTKDDLLFATLRLAIAYAEGKRWLSSRRQALAALRLTRTAGSKTHKLRALLLLTVGNRARKRIEQSLRRRFLP